MDDSGNYHIIRDKHTARIHPDSKIKSYPKWMIYNQFYLSVNNFLSCVCSVTPKMLVVLFFTSDVFQPKKKMILIKIFEI